MPQVEGSPAPLLRVATNHAATGLMRGSVAEGLPIEHFLVLVGEAAAWVGVGVDKEIPISLIEWSAGLQKLPVPYRECPLDFALDTTGGSRCLRH